MNRLSIIIALVLAGASATAHADGETCDGGSTAVDIAAGVIEAVAGGSGSGSSSGNAAGPAEATCDSDVHGYGNCHSFGAWSNRNKPALQLETGMAVRGFASPLGNRHGTVQHERESFGYEVTGPAASGLAPLETAVVAQLRGTVGLRYGFYVGAETEAGYVTGSHVDARMASSGELGTPDIEQTSVTTFGGVAVAGIGGRLGPISVGVEGAGGFRALQYRYESTYLACITTTSITTATPVLESRARAAIWVNPFVSVGATYGKSLVDDAWLAGAYVNWSSRAFAGR